MIAKAAIATCNIHGNIGKNTVDVIELTALKQCAKQSKIFNSKLFVNLNLRLKSYLLPSFTKAIAILIRLRNTTTTSKIITRITAKTIPV